MSLDSKLVSNLIRYQFRINDIGH